MQQVQTVTPINPHNERCEELGLTPQQAVKHGIYEDAKTGHTLQVVRNYEGQEITFIPKFGQKRQQYNKVTKGRKTLSHHIDTVCSEKLAITRYTPVFIETANEIVKRFNLAKISNNSELLTFLEGLKIDTKEICKSVENVKGDKGQKLFYKLKSLFFTKYGITLKNHHGFIVALKVGKYKFPAKSYTGIGVLPMPNNTAISNYKKGVKGGDIGFLEGYFKVTACSVVGLDFVGFTGISAYKLDNETKDYILKRQPKSITINYDGDALKVTTKSKTISNKRISGFFNSAYKFAHQLFKFIEENDLKIKVYLCHISPNLKHKGFDDLLHYAKRERSLNAVLAAYKSKKTSEFFTYTELFKSKFKKQLINYFGVKNHVAFYEKNKSLIGNNPFNFYGATYQHKSILRQSDGTPINKNQFELGKTYSRFDYFELKNNPFHVELETTEITVNKYVGEAYKELLEFMFSLNGLALQAPTGAGKTTWILEFARRTGIKIVLGVPTRMLCKQLGNKGGVTALYGNMSFKKYQKAINSNIVVCTYDVLHKIQDLESRFLIVDEAHNIINGYGLNKSFREKTVKKVVDLFDTAKKTVLISGTHNRNLIKDLGFDYVDIKQRQKQRVNVSTIEDKKPLTALISELSKLDYSQDKVHLVYLNDTDRIHEVKELLTKTGIIQGKDIATITRQDINKGNDIIYNSICDNELITGVKLVLCTCILAEGININNTNIGNLYAVNCRSVDVLKQFSARFRKMDFVNVYSIRKEETILQKSFFYDTAFKIKEAKEHAQLHIKYLEHYRTEHLADFEALERIDDDFCDIEPTYDYNTDIFKNVYRADEGYKIDVLRIIALEKERKEIMSNNAAFYTELATHDNIVLVGNEEISTVQHEEINKDLGKIKKEVRESKRDAIQKAKEMLLKSPGVAVGALYLHLEKAKQNLELIKLFFGGVPVVTDEMKAFYDDNQAAFKKGWIKSIIKNFIRLNYLGLDTEHSYLISEYDTEYKDIDIKRFLKGIETVALFNIYDKRHLRKHLTQQHKLEIKLKRKLYSLIVSNFADENGILQDIDKNELIKFISTHIKDNSIKSYEVNNLLSCFFEVKINSSKWRKSTIDLVPIFEEKGGKTAFLNVCSFLDQKDAKLLKIIVLCTS